MISNGQRLLLSLLVVGTLGVIATIGTFSAFSSTTSNTGNSFDAGSVVLGDNDGGTLPLYNVPAAKPGQDTVKCILLTYTGSLDADVKLYTASTVNASASNINLTIEKGTSSGSSGFPDCGTFTSQATIYSGTLANFASAKNSYDNGVSAYPGSATKWATGNTLVYRFTLNISDSGSGTSSGTHAFTWEARNQ